MSRVPERGAHAFPVAVCTSEGAWPEDQLHCRQ